MANLSISRTTIFIALAVLAIVAGSLLIFAQVNAVRGLRAEIEQERSALAQSQAELARLEQLRDSAPFYRDRLDALQRLIPAEPGEDTLLRYIHSLADEFDLRVVEVRFGSRSEAAGNQPVTMPLGLTLEGSYPDLLEALHYLRNGQRALRMDNLRLSKMGASAEVRATLSANAFYRAADRW